jgi:GNAT superfamily N-acetyltransferase
MDELVIELSWESTSVIDDEFGEPDNVIYPYCGDVLGVDENNNRTKIGKFNALYVDVGRAMDEQEQILDVLDCHSSSTAEYFEPIFGNNAPWFSGAVEKISRGEFVGFNLLILDRLEILPEFRGRGLGLKVLRHMMVRFSPGAGVIAMKVFPLQHESEQTAEDEDKRAWRKLLSLDSFIDDEEISTAKLKVYYERLGFESLPNSNFMVFNMNWKFPPVVDYGLKDL